MVVKNLLGLFVIFLIGFLARPCDAVLLNDGQELKKWCKFIEQKSADIQSNSFNTGLCMGFVAGVIDWRSLVNARGYCDIPKGVNLKQVALVVDKYIREHPERLNKPAADLVAWAVQKEWCENKPKN